MSDKKNQDTLDKFEKALNGRLNETYILKLYVTGMTPNSIRAIENIKEICRNRLDGRFELEVIDIYQHPEQTQKAQILAAPTLIKRLPPPLRRFIGDLSNIDDILAGLDLEPKEKK